VLQTDYHLEKEEALEQVAAPKHRPRLAAEYHQRGHEALGE
jgi:hypothetical protein